MKSFQSLLMNLTILAGVAGFSAFIAIAEEKPVTSSLGNPKIKLIGEMTLPSAINKIVFEKGKDGKSKIVKILTKDGLYSVDDELEYSLDTKFKQKNDDKTQLVLENISNDCRYAVMKKNTGDRNTGSLCVTRDSVRIKFLAHVFKSGRNRTRQQWNGSPTGLDHV